ncbi:DNA-directed RNA polymerase III subunit C3 [Ceratobasidium theobromae]|uniref:DNA-directed RNA polymerase III subunit RPC3 n=1 Tax=Ceratobasidium theobromae TaxID=1582974 RepID=A0A5N5QQD5_9AGAM|nr:DNA-directed RNA polymerase III subunit C3 [Ceratobasidium theobromae]
MAGKETARLCEKIICSHFGPIAGKVASTLLNRGRLQLPALIRFTGFKPSLVRASLIALIQHNIVWHAEDAVEGEVLEIDWEECVARLRFGRILAIAKERFGMPGLDVISIILDHGKLRLPDVLRLLNKSDSKESDIYPKVALQLLTSSHLRVSTTASHISPRDKFIRYETEERKKHVGIVAPKDARQFRILAEARIRREREEAEAPSVGLIKRKAKNKDAGSGRSKKRQVVEEDAVDPEVYLKVNYAKFNVHIRNQLIEAAAREKYNEETAAVLKGIIKACEPKMTHLDEVRSDPVPTNQISQQFPENIRLERGIYLKGSSSGISVIREFVSILACTDNPTPWGVASAFLSISGGGGGGGGKVAIEFEAISKRLKRGVVEGVVRDRWGDHACRILRVLDEKGKLHEDHIAKIAMLAPNDVRVLVNTLSTANIVALQEVPKSVDRQPARTIYLWYIDPARAHATVLASLHGTLANIMERLSTEKGRVQSILDKRDRSDIAGDENRLNRGEREDLREWETKRDKLMVLVHRVEEAAFVLGVLPAALDSETK